MSHSYANLSVSDEDAIEINVEKAMSLFSHMDGAAERDDAVRSMLIDANRQMIAAQQRANEADRHVIAVCEQAESFLKHQESGNSNLGEGSHQRGCAFKPFIS